MSGSETIRSVHPIAQKKILELAEKRLERFASLFTRTLVRQRPDTIHDTRVWSRRLQQIIQVMFPAGRTKKLRRLVRTLRKVRRALGECRNLDVCIELTQQKMDATQSETVHRAWGQVQSDLREKRSAEVARFDDVLRRCDIVALIRRAQELLESAESVKNAEQYLRDSIAEAFTKWRKSYGQARTTREAADLHALRISGKRLRYQSELLADLGDAPSKSLVESLKMLQDELGAWHDKQVLLKVAAEFVAQPDYLAVYPGDARVLLTEMEKERQQYDFAVSSILKNAETIEGEKWRRESVGPRPSTSQPEHQKPFRLTMVASRSRKSRKTSSMGREASTTSKP
jgi:CHAD domain-containing protein